MTNAKLPTPEKLRTIDASFRALVRRQRLADYSPKLSAQNPAPENPVHDVAVGSGAGYIDTAATVRRSDPGLRRTNGCTADRDLALLKW